MNKGEGESCSHHCLASPPIPSLEKKKKSISQVCSLWLLRPVAGDSHYLVAGVKGLMSSGTHMSVWVSCTWLPGWLIPPEAGNLRGPGVTTGSVQSQEWLSVLILSLLFMFQGPSFYHRLRSSNKGRRKVQLQTIHGGNNFGILEGIQIFSSPY